MFLSLFPIRPSKLTITFIRVLIPNKVMKCNNCGMEITDLRVKTDECCRWVVMR